MRVMVIVKATADSEAEQDPVAGHEELFAAMTKFNEDLGRAGVLLAGDGLKPSRFGRRVRFDGARRTVTDGPFTESKELVAGYWIWQVRSMDEAVEWVRRCPNPMPGPSDVEIRPLYDPDDFAPKAGRDERAPRAAGGSAV